VQSTWVVLVAIAIAAVYIGLWDVVWSQIVSLVRLGG
jgi:preprotein translocase subunit SecE